MVKKSAGNFSLDKDYLDCVDDSGNCFIVYSAKIRFFLFTIDYASFIFSDQFDHLTEQATFHKSIVSTNSGLVKVSNKHLKINASWEKAKEPFQSLLYSNSHGIVNWNCHHPIAHCDITYNNNRTFSGLGYAETLYLSIKPWELPIEDLNWGRFLTPGIAITWIRWTGRNPINKIYLNGKEFNDAQYLDDKIIFNEGKDVLSFSDPTIICEGKFSRHLSKIPLLKLFINKAFLKSTEFKYKSKTTYNSVFGTVYHGWSIFEIVKWKH